MWSAGLQMPRKCSLWAEALASKHKGWTDVVVARINSELGCSHTYTFDKKAAKSVPGMELLA